MQKLKTTYTIPFEDNTIDNILFLFKPIDNERTEILIFRIFKWPIKILTSRNPLNTSLQKMLTHFLMKKIINFRVQPSDLFHKYCHTQPLQFGEKVGVGKTQTLVCNYLKLFYSSLCILRVYIAKYYSLD